ncbi:hypothetical protein ES703_124445 [subsurface metagenome]
MQEVGFAQPGIAVKKKRIVCIAERLAHGHTACVGKAVAWADYEVLKRIIGVKFKLRAVWLGTRLRLLLVVNGETHGDKMAGYLLRRPGEAAFAIVPQELDGWVVRTADFK